MWGRKALPATLAAGLLGALAPGPGRVTDRGIASEDHAEVRGVVVSCRGWGHEWGTDEFPAELARLRGLGVNWISIHPYADVRPDGGVTWREFAPDDPPAWLTRPIAEAHAAGMAILVIPHIAYWHGPFAWRGAIEFAESSERERFFADYRRWILAIAAATRGADAFAVGTELDRLVGHEAPWRELIGELREAVPARLTYAANWDAYERVPFWDALDAIGVQAYFPLSDAERPTREELAAGWRPVLDRLRDLSLRTGKPVVFTELGYDLSTDAARTPWVPGRREEDPARAAALQADCFAVALEQLARERDWLRGAFLWKWFVGGASRRRGNFLVDTTNVRDVVSTAWNGRGALAAGASVPSPR